MHDISIWEQDAFFAPQDIIIIGAGFSGLWTAFHLKKKFPKKKMLIIERNVIPFGASGRNAGFACFGSLTEIISDINTMGLDKTMQLINLRFKGLKTIRSVFPNKTIDYDPCSGFELLKTKESLSRLGEINKHLKCITGSSKTLKQNDSLIKKFGFKSVNHLLENRFEGALHAGKLLAALSQLLISMGVQILYATELKEFEEKNEGVLLTTNLPTKLKAEQMVICTNAFSKPFLPKLDLYPVRGQVLLTAPIKNLKFSGCFHYDEGFYYFRNLNDRLLLGGARNKAFELETTDDMSTSSVIQTALEHFLSETILPGKKPLITHRWAGIMAVGTEKFPIVKRVSKRTTCAVRLSGMGVALAPRIGKMAAKEINL